MNATVDIHSEEEKSELIGLINNSFIYSRNQTRSESGLNPLALNHNFFLDNSFSSYIFRVIHEEIMTKS